MSSAYQLNPLANLAFDALRRSTGVIARVMDEAARSDTGGKVSLQTEDGISLQLLMK